MGDYWSITTQQPTRSELSVVVRTNQPLGRLAMYLLDPESHDGLITWDAFDAYLVRRNYPVLRSPTP